MTPLKPHHAALLLVHAGFHLTAAGCASPWKKETLYAGPEVFIFREYQVRDGERVPAGFDHPADVTSMELDYLLRSLHYDHKRFLGGVEAQPVFRPGEVTKLAEPLALSLAGIGPDERARFLVTRRSLGSVLVGVSGVSGVVFQRPPGTLHIAFDAIDQAVDDGNGGRPDDVRFPHNPTEKTYRYGLVPAVASRLRRAPETGTVYRRWLEVDLEELRRWLAERPPDRAPERPREPGDDEPDEVEDEIRDRLERLRRLRDRGDISPEEYERERMRILESI